MADRRMAVASQLSDLQMVIIKYVLTPLLLHMVMPGLSSPSHKRFFVTPLR
jgi:hypothetical protein